MDLIYDGDVEYKSNQIKIVSMILVQWKGLLNGIHDFQLSTVGHMIEVCRLEINFNSR